MIIISITILAQTLQKRVVIYFKFDVKKQKLKKCHWSVLVHRPMTLLQFLFPKLSLCPGGGGGGFLTQIPTFDPESQSAKIPYISGGRGVQTQLPTFDPESKSAKIQNSLSVGGGSSRPNFQLLILNLNLLKSKILFVTWRGANYVRHLVRIWGELQNFDNNIFHQARASASQIVSMWRLIILVQRMIDKLLW